MNALIILAVLHRKAGRIEAALRRAWQVHDLVGERDERRGMALVEIGYLALERGQSGAALRGFEVVLSFARTTRVLRPAHSGVLAASLALWRAFAVNAGHVEHRVAALLSSVSDGHDPWNLLHAQLDAIAAFQALGDLVQADHWIADLERKLEARRSQHAPLAWAEIRLASCRESRLGAACVDGSIMKSASSSSPPTATETPALSMLIARLASLELVDVVG